MAVPDMISPYDIIHLDESFYSDTPLSELQLRELIRKETEKRFQRNGVYNGIVSFMEELGAQIEFDWETMYQNYYLNNMSASSYIQIDQPNVYPFHSEINHILESKSVSDDSPMAEVEESIVFDVSTDMPASLSRRAFGGRQELTPRLRFWVQTNSKQYPMMAKRKEYVITFKTYAQTAKVSHLMANALEYYIDTRKEVLFALGAQKFYVMGSNKNTEIDKKTEMAVREMRMYLRTEEWYVGEGVPIIDKISMEWVAAPARS